MNLDNISDILKSNPFYEGLKIEEQMNYVSMIVAIVFSIAATMISIVTVAINKIIDLLCDRIFFKEPSFAYSALLENMPIINLLEYTNNIVQVNIISKSGVLKGMAFNSININFNNNKKYNFNYLYPIDKLEIPINCIQKDDDKIHLNLLFDLNNKYFYITDIYFILKKDRIDKNSLKIQHYYTTRKNYKKWKTV